MNLTTAHLHKLQEGRKTYQQKRTQLVQQKIKHFLLQGSNEIGQLSSRELFIAGIALYWAEGFKHPEESGLGLATSDPSMAKFYIYWLRVCLKVPTNHLRLRVTANAAHQYRIDTILRFWSNYLDIPENQFTKPFFQNFIQKKKFPNQDSYYGVIRIHVSKSLDRLRKMRGWIDGLRRVSGYNT